MYCYTGFSLFQLTLWQAMISLSKNIFLFLQLMVVGLCSAQPPNLYFKKITVQNGLSNNKVNCVIQDKRGFIWIGTDDGLNRYDGNNFLIFRSQPERKEGLSGNIITALLEDANGILWIATADGGLTRYDYRQPVEKQFKQYRHNSSDPHSIPVNIINAVTEDKNGYLWLATSGKRAFRFNKQSQKFDAPIGKGTTTAVALCLDSENKIWVGRQGGGLLKINTTNLAYEYDSRYDNLYAKLPHVVVTSLFRDGDNNIWYGSWDKILYCYNTRKRQEEAFQSLPGRPGFLNDEVYGFAEDKQARIWMAGRFNGLHVYDKKQNKFYNYTSDPATEGTIADNDVNCVYVDKNDNLWVGTNKGLSSSSLKQQFTQQFISANKGSLTVYDFYKDNNRTLWIGTSNGIYSQADTGTMPQHRPIEFNKEKLAVTKFYKDADGSMYLGTNYSLFKYNASGRRVEPLPDAANDKVMGKIIESRVVSVLRDTIDNNPVLLASPYGHFMAYYDIMKKKWVSRLDSARKIVSSFKLKDNLIRKIYRSKSGKVWLAMSKEGLGAWEKMPQPQIQYYQNTPGDISSLTSNHVYDITDAGNGLLWVSTYGGGLHLFNTQTKRFKHITASANLLEGLATDGNGNVWMISSGNLHSYNPSTDTYTSYELPDIERSGGVSGYIYEDEEGMMYAGGNRYFIRFNPALIKKEVKEPEVMLTDFRVFNKSFSHLLFERGIRLKYNQNFFTIEFAAPHFSGGEKLYYSYMLEGVDKDWVDAGTRNFASYPNTGAGDFVFKVRASSENGKWGKKITAIRIKVVPPFWKTGWFYSLLALVITISAYALYRYRVNELLKRQAIRNKIAQDLHDNVGSTLSSISVYSQVAQIQGEQGNKEQLNEVLDKISTTSNTMIAEMNDIVWAINPANDNMEKIIRRMESFARPLLAARNMQFEFNCTEEALKLNLDMEKRKNFFLVFKEAVNNAIKYSGASSITVNITMQHPQLHLLVKDNGIGFSQAAELAGSSTNLGGNGLRNMQARARELKGEIIILSTPGRGTEIRLTLPL